VRVPERLILKPQEITAQEIDAERNAEIRRVMITRFGADRYIREGGAKLLHEDRDALGFPRRLWRKDLEGDEPIVMVELTNSTPEGRWIETGRKSVRDADGAIVSEKTFLPEVDEDGQPVRKKYFLRVHPELRPLQGTGGAEQLGASQELNCHNAIASLHGLTGEKYRPSIET
jgi:hypothetical protein